MMVNIVTLTETPQGGAETFKRRMEDGRKYGFNINNKGRRNMRVNIHLQKPPKVEQKPLKGGQKMVENKDTIHKQ